MTQKNKRINRIIFIVIGVLAMIVAAVASLGLLKYFNDHFIEEKPEIIQDVRLDRDEEKPEGDWIVEPDEPRYMSIDSLSIVNARIIGLGIKAGTENQLDDPKNIHDVGWYNKSSKPGYATNNKAGLYDGHNTGYYENGVFANLGQLAYGDIIKIERGDGQMFNFEVREVQTILLEEVDMTLLQQSLLDGVEGISIISCGGRWDNANQIYTHRVTVRAVLVE